MPMSTCAQALMLVLHMALLASSVVAAVGAAQSIANTSSYSAICVIAKDEQRYVREWVDHHLCLGEHQWLLCTCRAPQSSPDDPTHAFTRMH